MFLNALRNDTKEIFLKLCVQGSLINDNFENEEKEIISDYCREMDVEVHIPESKENLDDFLAFLSKNTNYAEKKIILFNLLTLLKSDGTYDDKEKSFINSVINSLDINEAVVEEVVALVDAYTNVCTEFGEIICR